MESVRQLSNRSLGHAVTKFVYEFEFDEKEQVYRKIHTHDSAAKALVKLGIKSQSTLTRIINKGLEHNGHFFAYTEEFIPPPEPAYIF